MSEYEIKTMQVSTKPTNFRYVTDVRYLVSVMQIIYQPKPKEK